MISVGKTQKKTVMNEFCNLFVKALSLTGMKLAQDLKGPCLKHGMAVMPVLTASIHRWLAQHNKLELC